MFLNNVGDSEYGAEESTMLFFVNSFPLSPNKTAHADLGREVPLRNVLEAYGYVLVAKALEKVPTSFSYEVIASIRRDIIQSDNRSSEIVNAAPLLSFVIRSLYTSQTCLMTISLQYQSFIVKY